MILILKYSWNKKNKVYKKKIIQNSQILIIQEIFQE
jgi:hypothetical protein